MLKENEKTGDLELEPVVQEAHVYEKIYMDLHEDEMQFTNGNFQILYHTLLEKLNQTQEFEIKEFIQQLDQNMAEEVVSILMEEEKYILHDWERKQIIPKSKTDGLAQLVTQTILSLRCFLIDKKVKNYQYETTLENSNNQSILEDVKDYLGLKMLLSRKLGQVVGGKI